MIATGTELYEQFMRRMFMVRGAASRRVRFRFDDRVHLLDMPGKGPLAPVVLVHGFSASGASQYLPLSLRLRPEVSRILLPDLPGHGMSSLPATGLDADVLVDALLAAMDASLDRPAVMFASSLAGGVAVQYALRRPESLRGLVLCSPSGAPFAPDEIAPFFRRFQLRSHRDALDFIDRLLPVKPRDDGMSWTAADLWPSAMRHAYAWGVRQQFNRPHLLELLERIPRTRFLEPDHLARLNMPVYLIWGRGDDVLPPSHFEFYRAHLPPHASIDTPPHFGHAPFLHHTDDLADRLIGFLRRLHD